MPKGVLIVDRDRGFKALMRRIKAAANTRAITVGVHSGEGGAPAAGGGTVSSVASAHEFGLGNNPERSFVRAWADDKQSENEQALKKLARAVVKGSLTVDEALNQLGLFFVASMQQRIRGGIPPELQPATIERKGSSTPLIDTGQLVSSITRKVE